MQRARSPRIPLKLSILVTALALTGAFAAAGAQATIYIGGAGNYIQTAPLGGGKAKNLRSTGGNGLAALAVGGRYLFWAYDSGSSNVGPLNRSKLNGKDARKNVVKGANVVNAIAADSKRVYFNDNAAIGVARLDGSGKNLNLVTGTGVVTSIAIDSTYIYWANVDGTAIGRARLDGTQANPSFISGIPGSAYDIAVSKHSIFWSNGGGTAIGRATIAGGSVNPTFITGMAQVGEVEVHGKYIYWTDAGGQIGPCDGPSCIPSSPGATAGSIDRAKLDGTGRTRIIKKLNNPNTLAVTGE